MSSNNYEVNGYEHDLELTTILCWSLNSITIEMSHINSKNYEENAKTSF